MVLVVIREICEIRLIRDSEWDFPKHLFTYAPTPFSLFPRWHTVFLVSHTTFPREIVRFVIRLRFILVLFLRKQGSRPCSRQDREGAQALFDPAQGEREKGKFRYPIPNTQYPTPNT